MKYLVFVVLAALLPATGVAAQVTDPAPLPAARTHDPRVYVDGDWTLPTPDQIKASWPARALQDKVEGRVTFDCTVAPNGRLSSCDIVAESPRGYGFGAAAVKLCFKFTHVDPASVTGGVQFYSRRKFDIVFAN